MENPQLEGFELLQVADYPISDRPSSSAVSAFPAQLLLTFPERLINAPTGTIRKFDPDQLHLSLLRKGAMHIYGLPECRSTSPGG